jgi:hypothetical protein
MDRLHVLYSKLSVSVKTLRYLIFSAQPQVFIVIFRQSLFMLHLDNHCSVASQIADSQFAESQIAESN